jgi:hypothetical protein
MSSLFFVQQSVLEKNGYSSICVLRKVQTKTKFSCSVVLQMPHEDGQMYPTYYAFISCTLSKECIKYQMS